MEHALLRPPFRTPPASPRPILPQPSRSRPPPPPGFGAAAMRRHEWPLGGSAGPRKALGAQADIQERFGAFESPWSA